MIYIVTALLIYTIGILLGTFASRNADTSVVSTLMNISSAVTPFIFLMVYGRKDMAINTKSGIIFAIAAGLLIGIFSLALNKSYATNKVGIVAPIVFGGAIFLSAILSFFFFKEKISFIQGIGLTLLGIGLVVVIYARATGK